MIRTQGPKNRLRWIPPALCVALCLCVTPERSTAGNFDDTTSRGLLLTPAVKPGETFTWVANISTKTVTIRSDQAPKSDTNNRRNEWTCRVTDANSETIDVSRSIRSEVRNRWYPSFSKPPIVLRNGREYLPNGDPLNDDPICMFYSSSKFGNPPTNLHVGTLWHFTQTTYYGRPVTVRGVASVASMDLARRRVTLHVVIGTAAVVDVTLDRGGIVVSESDRDSPTSERFSKAEVGTNFRVLQSTVTQWRLVSDLRR